MTPLHTGTGTGTTTGMFLEVDWWVLTTPLIELHETSRDFGHVGLFHVYACSPFRAEYFCFVGVPTYVLPVGILTYKSLVPTNFVYFLYFHR